MLIHSRRRTVLAQAAFAICATTLASAVFAAPPSGDYRLVWGDEFNGNFLDGSKWNVNYPWGTRHNHNATMSASQIALGDGTMTLTATRTGPGANDFVSGAINTGYTKKTFNGGYLEASIKLPSTVGSWPAFWGLYDGWPPEADIMEYPLGAYDSGDYHTAFHYRNSSGGNSAGAGKINNPHNGGAALYLDYHTFGMEWIEDDWVGFYFDGRLVSQFGDDAAIAQMQRMYLILNYAVGGWPGTPSTSQWAVGHSDQTKVDWVRVWDRTAALDRTSLWVGGSGDFDNTANWSDDVPSHGNQHMVFSMEDGATRAIDWIGERRTGNLKLGGDAPFLLGNGRASLTMSDADHSPNITVLPGTTAAHDVRAVLDPVGTLTIANNGDADLRVSGVIRGSENILVDGTAPVVFAGNNRHSGDTIIDGGSQGPAILRVEHSNAFGTGNVVFNPQGNNTSGQLQLANGITLTNAISLSGRHNTTPAILNVTGNNTLAGDIHLQVGGGNYRIASDSGLLTLAGILRAEAGGSRTVTFEGSAEGLVTGNIVNGNATLNLIKDGTGTWTLAGSQSHTGTVTVRQGLLLLDGVHQGGAGYLVNQDGTLGGTGEIVLGIGANVELDGTLLVDLSDENVLDISGGVTLGETSRLALMGLEELPENGRVLATFTPNQLVGSFDVVLHEGAVLGESFDVIYDNAAGELRLVAIPEPGSMLALVALASFSGRRRRP